MPQLRGDLSPGDRRFAIVASRFNEFVTSKLLEGACQGFRDHGLPDEAVVVTTVPGAMEIPLVARRLAKSGRYAAVVCLGAVIRGETPHFEYVAGQAAAGIAAVARETGVPVLFGVLTTDTVEQAKERAGGTLGNKGYDAAVGALEMASLIEQIDKLR